MPFPSVILAVLCRKKLSPELAPIPVCFNVGLRADSKSFAELPGWGLEGCVSYTLRSVPLPRAVFPTTRSHPPEEIFRRTPE